MRDYSMHDEHLFSAPQRLAPKDRQIAALSLPSIILLPFYLWPFAFNVRHGQAGALDIILVLPVMLLVGIPAFIGGIVTWRRVVRLSPPNWPAYRYRSPWEATLMYCGMLGVISSGFITGIALLGCFA